MTTNPIKGVIFDFNGTLLFDTPQHEQAWREYARKLCGREITEDDFRYHIHGRTNAESLRYFLGDSLTEREIARHGEEKEAVYRRLCLAMGDRFHLADGAKELLDALKRGPACDDSLLPLLPEGFAVSSSRIEETSRSMPNMRFKVSSCTQTSAPSAESLTSVSIASNPRRAAQMKEATVFSGASDWHPRWAMRNGPRLLSASRSRNVLGQRTSRPSQQCDWDNGRPVRCGNTTGATGAPSVVAPQPHDTPTSAANKTTFESPIARNIMFLTLPACHRRTYMSSRAFPRP